jgi:hypothetical protein
MRRFSRWTHYPDNPLEELTVVPQQTGQKTRIEGIVQI